MSARSPTILSRRHCLAMLALALGSRAAASTAPTGWLRGAYRMYASGFEVAELELAQRRVGGELVEMHLEIANRGVAAFVGGRHRLRLTTSFAPAGGLVPARFVSFADKPDRARRVTVHYDADGEVTEIEVDNDGRVRASLVPRELWPGTLDPLSALARLQAWAPGAAPGAELALALFDGRKRADMRARRPLDGAGLELALVAIFGFEREEDEFVSWPGEPPKLLRLTLDDGEPPLPALLRGDGGGVSSELRLEERRSDR